MPGTLVDRLPLPNLKVYTTGSVVVLSIAVYYALNVTSDTNWRLNSTIERQELMAEVSGSSKVPSAVSLPVLKNNGTKNVTEQFVDVMTFMMQEPLCMWSVINMAYCSLALFGFAVQRCVFGKLRVAEAQRLRDKFWNYVFYKFIFIFGVLNVQFMDELVLWCSWFTLLGCLHLLSHLCKDRFEYLSSSASIGRWAQVRMLCLLVGILGASMALLAAAVAWGLPAGRDMFAFMAAECILVVVCAVHVCARYALQLYEADVAGPVAYYTHLVFDSASLAVELVHVVHMVVYSNMLVSMASLVLLMQLRHLLHELQARLRRHRLYTSLATHMSRNYPMASKEEMEENQDNCAICWEPMKEARKLPCAHLFHNSCLCQWVQQDASCPTCRRALSAGAAAGPDAASGVSGATGAPAAGGGPGPGAGAPASDPLPWPRHPNHFFHFDGSRYVSWLPSFSVEVTRVRPDAAAAFTAVHLHSLAREVQVMFPQYSVGALVADLAATRSADLTLENILEGRLPPDLHRDHSTEAASRATNAVVSAFESGLARGPAPADGGSAGSASSAPPDGHSSSSRARFPHTAAERETLLRQRKHSLIAKARRSYLKKMSAGSSASVAPPTPPPSQASSTSPPTDS